MKRIIFWLLMAPLAVMAQTVQPSTVPSVVLNTFKQHFPKATGTEWEFKNNVYEAEFEIGRLDHEVWINKNGTIIKHKEELSSKLLPTAVREHIRNNFKGYRANDTEKLTQGNKVFYKVELKSLTKEQDVVFSEDGTIVEGFLW